MNSLSRCCLVVIALTGASVSAAPCDLGFLLKQGTVAEITRFTPSHQPTGKVVSTIVSSVAKDDTIAAVATVDNYLGANKASTSIVDFVCDGKQMSMNTRNQNAMKDFFGRASSEAAQKGQKILDATVFSEPQIYPLGLKVGDVLPPWKAYSIMVVQKAPPDWGKVAATGDWTAALNYAFDHKFAGGVQMVTKNIKVVGEDTCALYDGSKVACLRITKETYVRPISGKDDLKGDPSQIKGAPPMTSEEWLVPGIGLVKGNIGPIGHPIMSLALTALTR